MAYSRQWLVSYVSEVFLHITYEYFLVLRTANVIITSQAKVKDIFFL